MDMILSSRTQFSGDRTRLRTERPVRAVNTAYGRVFTIIRQRPSQKPSDRRTGHMAYLCPNFAEPVHPTHHGQPTPRACHCNNTEQRAITMRSVLVVQAELFTIICPTLAKPHFQSLLALFTLMIDAPLATHQDSSAGVRSLGVHCRPRMANESNVDVAYP